MTCPDHVLTTIASEHLGIPTLQTRNSDSLDFHEVSVWSLKHALSAAYQAGVDGRAARHAEAHSTHTPEPWDFHGCTTMYVTPDESDEISMIEVRANVTESGWDTIAFLEAVWPCSTDNARRIVAAVNACQGIPTTALESGVLQATHESPIPSV